MKRYGLIGRTLTHSFSETYFSKKFVEEGLTDVCYQNFELPAADELPQLLIKFPDLKGLNVTIPYKEDVLPFLNEKNKIVEDIGACNCIKIEGNNLTGYNTDVIGFRQSIQPKLKKHHKKALILGTGGVSKAIRYVLNELGIEYCLVSRRKKDGELGYEDLGAEVLSKYQVIINTTPLGMFPNITDDPSVPY
ncbi:MAG: shikimate dehydrogenase, partial [Bacteroidota bacterium]|nr:shikimate dehydrogenase [Bacteroidota bacterium]